MFEYRNAASGREQRGASGNVDTSRRVSSGPYDINPAHLSRYVRPPRKAAHSFSKTTDFIGIDALGAQSRQHGAGHGLRSRWIRQLIQQLLRLQLAQIAAVEKPLEGVTRGRHGALPPERSCAR